MRNLAQRSATAAREIKGLIQDSVAKVQDGSRLVDESGRHLNDIVAAAKKVADIIGEISAASQEQANGLDQVNHAMTQMDESTQRNAEMAHQTSSVAGSMTSQAKALTDLIALFKIQDATPEKAERRAPAKVAQRCQGRQGGGLRRRVAGVLNDREVVYLGTSVRRGASASILPLIAVEAVFRAIRELAEALFELRGVLRIGRDARAHDGRRRIPEFEQHVQFLP